MKQLYRVLVALATALVAILATRNARADMPDNTFGTVGTAADGSYLVEVGRGVSVARVVDYYDKIYREATKNDDEPNGEPLTWGVIHAENEGRVIPYCSRPKNGPRWLPTRSTMVWNDCDENDRSIILIAGPSGRIKVPVKAVESFVQMQARLIELDAFVKSLGCKRSDVACLKSKVGGSSRTPQTYAKLKNDNDRLTETNKILERSITELTRDLESLKAEHERLRVVPATSPRFTLSYTGIPMGIALLFGFALSQAFFRPKNSGTKKPLNPREVETQKSLKPPSAEKLGIKVPDSPWKSANGSGASTATVPATQPRAPATVALDHGLQAVPLESQELIQELMQTAPASPERKKAIEKRNGKSKSNGANGHALPPATPDLQPRVEDLHATCRHDLDEAEYKRVADLSKLCNKAIDEIAKRDVTLANERRAHAATQASLAMSETRIAALSEELAAFGRSCAAANANGASLQMEVSRVKQQAEDLSAEVGRLKSDSDKLSAIRETYSNADSVQSNVYLAVSLAAAVESDQLSLRRDGGQTEKGEASFRALLNEREMAKASFIRSLALATNRNDASVVHLFSALFRPLEEPTRSDIPASSNSRYEESGPLRLPEGVAQPPLPDVHQNGFSSEEPPRDEAGEAYLRRHTDPSAKALVANRVDTQPLRFGAPNAVVPPDEPSEAPPPPSLSAPLGEFPGAQELLASASSDNKTDDPNVQGRVSKIPTLVPPPPPTVRTPNV